MLCLDWAPKLHLCHTAAIKKALLGLTPLLLPGCSLIHFTKSYLKRSLTLSLYFVNGGALVILYS